MLTMNTPISDDAASARENARTSDGKFGHQPKPEASFELGEDDLVVDWEDCHVGTSTVACMALERTDGPVRAEHLAEANIDRISYTDRVAGPVEIYVTEHGMPVIVDSQGRNLRATEAAGVLLEEHRTDEEAAIGRVKLSPADQVLLNASAQQFPGQLSAVEHSLRTLRAAGLRAAVFDTTVDPMSPSFSVVAPTPWVVDVAFSGADHVRLTSGSTEVAVHASPDAVVDPYELRNAILDLAHSRSYSHRAGGVAQVIDPASVARVDEWGGTEEHDPAIEWNPDGAVHTSVAFTDSDEDSPRLELHGEGEDRRLLLAFEGSGQVPESVRAAIAAVQIRHRNPGATPELVIQTIVEGERTWERFRTEDPYGMTGR